MAGHSALRACGRSSSPSAMCSIRAGTGSGGTVHERGMEGPSAAQYRPGARSSLSERNRDVILLRHGPVRRAQLQHGGARAAGHRQEPPVPAGLALRPSDLGRQGDGGAHVRQQRHRPARAGLPVRRGLLRRGFRRLLRPEGRRQHHEGLHGVRRVQPRPGEASAPTVASCWSATSTWTWSTSSASVTCSARCPGDAQRHRLHGPHPRLPARLGCAEGAARTLFTDHFGLVSDFLSECLTQLRWTDPPARPSKAGCSWAAP
jgi:hypothetical protein